MKGQSSFGTGDINLAAALATLGIPPDAVTPIELVARDDGRDYIRFHFLKQSACGKYDVLTMSEAWSTPDAFTRAHPAHPFTVIMGFISSRPRGCHNQDDWLTHAADHLQLPVSAVRKTYADIGRACKASPESPVSYICAYIRNRMDMIHAAKRKEAAGDFMAMQSRGKSVSMIPAKAPARIRDFLLSHIR